MGKERQVEEEVGKWEQGYRGGGGEGKREGGREGRKEGGRGI